MLKTIGRKNKISIVCIVCLLAGLALPATSALAQAASSITLSTPDLERFPTISLNFEALDANGPIADLAANEVSVVENGEELPLTRLDKVQPGLDVILAINGGPVLSTAIKNTTQYERIRQNLGAWARSQKNASGKDLFSLVVNQGVIANQVSTPEELVEALDELRMEPAKLQPNLVALSQALDLATDMSATPGLKHALLYITPIPNNKSQLGSLPNLANRARQMGLRIYVWQVGATAPSDAEALDALRQLSSRTGGEFLSIPGGEELPDLETYFTPLRSVYRATYLSKIRTAGAQKLMLRIDRRGKTIESADYPLTMNLQPPTPIFLNPPAQVQYTLPPGGAGEEATLNVPISILIEFPDKIKRSIRTTRLYLDGKLVAENTHEPFDQFDLPLSNLSESQHSQIKVAVEDELGLARMSIEAPFDVLVEKEERPQILGHFSESGVIAISGLLVAATILGVLFVRTRKRARRERESRTVKRPPSAASEVPTQPTGMRAERPTPVSARGSEMRLWPVGQSRNAPARLVRLASDYAPLPGATIPLTRTEMTLGSDPHAAMFVFEDATVEKLHARLSQVSPDTFHLADAGSLAGTWVNCTPISAGGRALEHGDLIQIGRVALRFELAKPVEYPPVEVVTEEDL